MKPLYILLMLLVSSSHITKAQQPTEDERVSAKSTVAEEMKVCVIGDGVWPSLIPLKVAITSTQAIREAGGTQLGDKNRRVNIYRRAPGSSEGTMIVIDMKLVRKGLAQGVELQAYDVVEVMPLKKGKETLPRGNNVYPPRRLLGGLM